MSKKYTIRKGTFETNSSSAHTFVFVNDENKEVYTDKIDEKELEDYASQNTRVSADGKKYLKLSTGDNYSSSFEILTKWSEKASYVIASYKNDKECFKNNVIPAILSKFPGFSGIVISFYSDYLDGLFDKEILKKGLLYNSLDNPYDSPIMFGEVDHQSYDNTSNMVKALSKLDKYKSYSTTELIAEIIWNPKIIIVTDSDSCDTIEDLYQAGVIDSDLVISVRYTNGYDAEPDVDLITLKELKNIYGDNC